MISDIMPPVNEDEEIDAHTMFGDLRKNLVKEFASEISGYTDNFERLKVYLRVRPFTLEEIAANKESCLTFEDENYVNAIAPKESHTFKNTNKNIHKFKFSKIFKEDTDQSEFYDNTVKKLVDDFLIGQNCLVFAYGVTNAGKSYTVQGNPKNPGVLPRTLETIFNHVNGKQWKGLNLKPKMFLDVVKLSPNSEQEERNKKDLLLRMASWDDSDSSSIFTNSSRESCPLEIIEKSQESDVNDEELLHSTHLNETAYGDQIKYSVWISFAEVYNEQVFDLLEAPNLKKRKLLKLGEDKHGNPYIRGLTEVNVSSSEEALKLMTIGQKNLRKASTKLNHNSSRSHCIFNIKLLRVVNRENPSVAKVTTLSLCDLAGSERACKTNSTGDRLKEAGNINTSLLTLGRCIETMRSNQIKKDLLPRMIPYRESKLTRLFQGFFSGRGKAVMIVNVSKCSSLYDETLHVFKFSAIAKQVLIQQKVEKPISLTISPVLPVKPLTHLERASIPWADDVHEISRVNYSNRLSTADETMEEEELTEREKALIDIIDNCKKAITHLKESLAKEKKERMLDEIYIRDEITKELMEEFVMIEKKYDEKIQMNRHLAEEAADERIAKLIETLNPNKKRSHDEVESEEEMVPLHVFQESQEKIKQCEVQIQELTQRLESTKTQMRRMTSDHSKLACENTCLQFQVSDMLQIPMPQKIPQCESLSDNLEHANVLSKLTSMLKSTQEKLKEKQSAVDELEEQLQEAGETFLQNQKQMEALKEMVESLKESNKKPAECEACKSRNETSWQLNPELKTQAGSEQEGLCRPISNDHSYQKQLTDFEERERALINGYNAEISKYKNQLSQLRLQLAHTKHSPLHLSPTKSTMEKTKENNSNQSQIKHYLLRQVKRLQEELDKNSQSVAEVHQALELKRAAEIDLEQRLAHETAGHRQAKVLISELKAKVKRLGERCRSASFEAEKTFAAIESELSLIENQRVSIPTELSDLESFESAKENSFDLGKGGAGNMGQGGKENQLVKMKVFIGGESTGEQTVKKKKKKVLGENGSLRLDPECLEQKIISKNMEIVRLQEKLLVQSKLEHDLKDLSGKNQELVTQLTEMSNLQAELKKKALLIRNLEEKLKDTEVLEVEIESQTAVIQHLQAAVNERTKLLAEIQNGPEKGVSKGNDSPVSERKLEEMEMVVADLREMVDKITKELSKKEEKIQALTNEKKNSQKSLKDNVETLKREISSLELEVKGFKKEKEEQKVLKNGMEKELESMKTENKRICESLNSVKKELESSQKEIKEMNDLKNSLLKKVEEFKVENKELNELKNSLLKKFEEFKLENKENKNMKNSLIDNLEAIKLEFETVSNLKNNLVKDLETSKVESKRILDLKNSLTKELENLKSENESVLSQNNSLINELKSLKEEKEKMDGLKNSMAKDFKNLEEEKERILERKNFLEEKLENVEKEKEGNFEGKNLLETELKNLKDECKKMSDLKDSLDKENKILKEQHKTILDEKKSLQSELDSKNLEILSLTESQKSKELVNEKLSTKTKNDFNKSLALAKMAQKELEENLEAKKKELKAKGMELTKISKLLEEKNEENAKLESKIIDLCKEQDLKPPRIGNNMEMDSNLEPMGEAIAKDSKALLLTEEKESLVVAESQIDVLVNKQTQSSMIVHRVGKEKGEECKSEIADDGSKGVLVVEEKSKTPEEEISELKKDLDDSIQAREKLLLEISSLVSLLSEKDLQIAELTTIGKSNGDEDVLPKIAKEGTDNNPSVVTDRPKSNVGPEEHLKEGKSLRVEDYQRISCVKMVTTTATQTSENETNEKENFGNKSEEKEEEKEFCVEKRKCGNERKLEDFDELQTELEKVRMSLEEERTLNDALQFDLAAANAELDQLKTDYDHEINISFNLKYELNDVKGSLSEALSCFNQLNQTKTDSKIENEKMKLSNESNKKNLEDLEPEKMQLVEDLQKQKEKWQAKYEEVSLQLISERQKLLDARQSQSENFYLRRDNEELKMQLTNTEKQLQEVQSRQEIQLITMETEQMTQKLIEDRKKSEEQHLRDDLDHLQKELGNAHEKMKSYEELEVELIQLRSEVAHLKEEAVQKESVKHSPDKGENSPRDGLTVSSNNLNEESIAKQTEVINKESGHYLPDKGENSPRDGPTVSSNNLNENSIGKQTEVINKESGHYLPDKGETSPRDGPTVSSNNVNEESIAKQTEALKSDVKKKCEHCEMNRNSALEKMHKEIEVLSKELATAQKETDELRAKVEAKNKLEKEESLLTGTSLIDTKIGSNRQLRREKILAEQSKMEAEFKLKITQEEVRSLTKRLEKFEGDGSVSNGQDENSRRELEAAKREIGRLESKLKENEERISKTGNGQMDGTNKVQHLQEELKESVDKLKNEKEKVLKLEDDVSQKTCVIDILRDSLKEQEEVMVSFEKLILQKDEAIKRLNNQLSAEKMSVKEEKGNAIGGSPTKNKSLETERLKTVVSNQTETIQILSERNNQQELMGKTIRDDLQNLKMSMTIITAERDSLRKRLHLVETSCKCNKEKEKTLDVKSKEGLSDVETLKISVTNSVSSSDDKACLSSEVDELSPLKKEELTSNSSLVKEEYREIDVTPPVATKALKKNRKRKPLDIQAQELPAETPRRLFRRSKSVALKKIHTMSSSNAKETSPMNKKKKSMEHESESVTEEQTSENSQNKGKTALSRFKTLTNSFRSPSFRGAKNMLTSPRTWSLKETPKKNAHVSPNVRCSPSTRPAISSTSVSKTKTNVRLTASEADDKSHRELRDILSSTTTHQRKRRLYKEEIIGPMSYESQIVKTRTMTTVRPKDDVFSIVKQQLKGLHK